MSKTKTKTQSTKKRKREKAPTLSISHDQQINQKNQNASDGKEREEISLHEEGVYSNRKETKRKKKTTKQKSSRKVADDQNNNRKIDSTEFIAKRTPMVPQQQGEESLHNRSKERERLRKKRKKKRKRALSPSACLRDDGENETKSAFETIVDDKNDMNESTLEGSLVSNVLVLIDRKARKVYSATGGRLQNGERKVVGCLDEEGQVVLYPTTAKVKNGTNNNYLFHPIIVCCSRF